jgi:Flp pilus assembly protein TadG
MSRRRARDDRGSSAVEFALVMTPLLMIVFGIIQYGLYFWAMQGGADAGRQAARLAAVGNPASCDAFAAAVKTGLDNISTSASTATVTRTYSKSSGNTASGVEIGDSVTVRVRFQSADMHLPFVPFIDGGWVEDTAKARVDYVPVPTIGNCS